MSSSHRWDLYLWIEVVDALNGLLNIATLHSLSNFHAVCYRCQVYAWLCHGLLLKCLCSLHIPLWRTCTNEKAL